MATQHITFRGKAHYCKPYEGQIDRAFEDKEEGTYANWNTGLKLDDETLVAYKTLGLSQVKVKDGNQVTFKRSEFKLDRKTGELQPLGPPSVRLPDGVADGAAIGNDSDISVHLEVYDYTYKNRPGKAARWTSVTVHDLVVYEAPAKADAEGPKVPF